MPNYPNYTTPIIREFYHNVDPGSICIINRKHIFAQPLLAFNVEVGSKLWTKFIEKVEIHQRRPNSEHILNYNFGQLQQKTEWGLGSLEVTMASKLFLHLFWLNSLDQPQL